jgi:hypothetical protein
MKAFARVITACAVVVGSFVALAPAASAAETEAAPLPYPVLCLEVLPDTVTLPVICLPWPL